MKVKKPPKCTHPDCFQCPYADCRYDRLEASDYTESNNRDYFLYFDSTGRKLHKPVDKVYRDSRQAAYARANRKYYDRHDYNQRYYKKHAEEIKKRQKDTYDTEKNTIQSRKWRKKNTDRKKQYDHERYLKRKANGEFIRKKEEVMRPVNEQETSISYSRDGETATVYTSDSTVITKLDKLVNRKRNTCWKVKEEHRDQGGNLVGKTYETNKKLISFRSEMQRSQRSAEQKAASAERMRKMWEQKKHDKEVPE